MTTMTGYANLFHGLLSCGGVRCAVIGGVHRLQFQARGTNCRSAWNAFCDRSGDWYLVDCGYIRAFKAFDLNNEAVAVPDFFFATYPELFSQFNCPDDPKWQLVSDSADRMEPADFTGLPIPTVSCAVPFRFVKPWPGAFFKFDSRYGEI